MNRWNKHEEKPICPDLQEQIDTLSWAGNALKAIPNLPKGKFRDHIESEVRAIIGFNNSPLKERLEAVKLLLDSLDPLHVLCRSLVAKKRLSPEEVSQLLDFVDTACDTLKDVRGTHY